MSKRFVALQKAAGPAQDIDIIGVQPVTSFGLRAFVCDKLHRFRVIYAKKNPTVSGGRVRYCYERKKYLIRVFQGTRFNGRIIEMDNE